jgi:predicted transcriptional regulator
MEVQFDPELQAKLSHLAAQQGRKASELVQDALARYVEDETTFLEAVEEGIAAAERGEFIEEEEMDARVERMLKP